jgi:hypothetical protein
LLERRVVRAEQLTKRVVDSYSLNSQNSQQGEHKRGQHRDRRSLERNEREPLGPERDAVAAACRLGREGLSIGGVQALICFEGCYGKAILA